MASAPARTAARTPSASVMPQIFTKGVAAPVRRDRSGARRRPRTTRTAAAGSAARTSASPTSAASKPTARHAATVAASRTPDSATTSRSSGTSSRSRTARSVSTVERPQVAVVEPDEPGVRRERALELPLVVGLDERLEPDLERPVDEAREALRRMEDGEQQDEVGAGRAEVRQLDRLDDELLGEDRDAHRRPDGPQVVDGSAEPVRLAQDRDRGRAAGLVGPRAGDDVLVRGGDGARPTASCA